MTVIGAPPAGPEITDQDAFDEAVRKIKEKFSTEYNYTISHEDAVNAAMGKPTKVKVRTPTLARTSEIAKLTGMWGEGPDAKPTVDYLNTQANQTGMWGMGDAAVPTLKKTGQEFDQGITYGEAMGFNTVPLITATGLIGDFSPPTNEATRKALMGTLRRKYEEVYHNTPTDMQLNTLIDVGELKNVRMTTLAGAKLESDIAAGTGTVRGQLTIAGRQMDLTETMSALDAAIAEAGVTGVYTSPDGTMSSVDTLQSKKLQLETAQVSGYLNTGEPVLQLLLAEMDIDAQERIVFGYDTYDKYGNLTHTYGTNEIQLVAQRRDVEWQKMKTAGFEYIDPITGDSVHVMGSQELLDHQWTQEEMTRTGYNELQRDPDGNVMYGPGGQPLMRHTMGTQEMDMYQVNLSARLQNKGMDAEDARYYAGLDWQEKQASGFFVIKKNADGTPVLGPDGKPQQQYVRGTSGENDQDRALQRWIISTGKTHEEAMQILRGVQDMEHLNGWDIYNKDTGKIEHVMGTAEWEQHMADRDQVYQNTLLHGGFVTVQAEDGTTYTREIEGSVSLDERQRDRADTLVRDGWDREDAAAQAAWEREQKQIFGYWTYKDGGHQLEWVPGTFETEHDLQIDTLEKQDGMVRYREMMAHVRATFMLAAQTRDKMELADAQRDWEELENIANRDHLERLQQIDADQRLDFKEWQMEYERTNMFIEGVAGAGFEGIRWGLNRIFGGGDDDNPLPDFTNPAAVLAWMRGGGASAATIASFEQYVQAHPELFTGAAAAATFVVKNADGTVMGTFPDQAAADVYARTIEGATVNGAAPAALNAGEVVVEGAGTVATAANPFLVEQDGVGLQSFPDQAAADRYAADHPGSTVRHVTDFGDGDGVVGPIALEAYKIEGLDGTTVYSIDGAEYSLSDLANAQIALDEFKNGNYLDFPYDVKDAAGNVVDRFRTRAEAEALISSTTGLVEGRWDVLNADKVLGPSDYIQGVLSFAAGYNAEGGLFNDALALGGMAVSAALFSAVCFPMLGAAYLAGRMARSVTDSIYDTFHVDKDKKEFTDAVEIKVNESAALPALLNGLPQDVVSTIAGMGESNYSSINVTIDQSAFVKWNQDYAKDFDEWKKDPSASRGDPPEMGDPPPVMVITTANGHSPENPLYTETLQDFQKRTGFRITSFRGAEQEVYEKFSPSLKDALADLKVRPTSFLENPDGSVVVLGRDNKQLMRIEAEEWRGIMGDTTGSMTPVVEGWLGELDTALEASEVDRNWLYSITANSSDALDALRDAPLSQEMIQLWKGLPDNRRGNTDAGKAGYTLNEQRAILGDLSVVFREEDPTSFAAAKDNFQAEEIVKSTGVSREDLDLVTGVLDQASRSRLMDLLMKPGHIFTAKDIASIFRDEAGDINNLGGGLTGLIAFMQAFVETKRVRFDSDVPELGA